jgi:hypothetical protein
MGNWRKLRSERNSKRKIKRTIWLTNSFTSKKIMKNLIQLQKEEPSKI